MPLPVFVRLGEEKAERVLAPALRRDDPVMLARLEGIAEGAAIG